MNPANSLFSFLTMPALLVVTACSHLSESDFQKIRNGMSPEQVKAILGNPSEIQYFQMAGAAASGITYIYRFGSSNATITFYDDKVGMTSADLK